MKLFLSKFGDDLIFHWNDYLYYLPAQSLRHSVLVGTRQPHKKENSYDAVDQPAVHVLADSAKCNNDFQIPVQYITPQCLILFDGGVCFAYQNYMSETLYMF